MNALPGRPPPPLLLVLLLLPAVDLSSFVEESAAAKRAEAAAQSPASSAEEVRLYLTELEKLHQQLDSANLQCVLVLLLVFLFHAACPCTHDLGVVRIVHVQGRCGVACNVCVVRAPTVTGADARMCMRGAARDALAYDLASTPNSLTCARSAPLRATSLARTLFHHHQQQQNNNDDARRRRTTTANDDDERRR
jgi:hypothetical protein